MEYSSSCLPVETNPGLLRCQMERRGLSTAELPVGHSLVGFDASGFTSSSAGRSGGELAALGGKVDRFAADLVRRFGLLLTGKPAGDSATFVAGPSFDERAYRAFINDSRLAGLALRSGVARIGGGTASVSLLPGGALGLSGQTVLEFNAQLNGRGGVIAHRPSTQRHPVLDVNPLLAPAPSSTSVVRGRESVNGLVLKVCDNALADPVQLKTAVSQVLQSAPPGVRLQSFDDGLLFLEDPSKKWEPNLPCVRVVMGFTPHGSRILGYEDCRKIKMLKAERSPEPAVA